MNKLVIAVLISLSLIQVGFADFDVRDIYSDEELNSSAATKTVTLFLAGDLMLHGAQIKSSYQPSTQTYDFSPWFKHLVGLISNADFALVNFESTITENPSEYSGYPMFRSPHHIAADMKEAGFDIAVTANNHALDNRLYGVEKTLEHLQAQGLLTTGTCARGQSAQPVVVEKNGLKIGVFSATYGTNGFAQPKDHPTAVNMLTDGLIADQVAKLKAQNVDVILAFVHWGNEYARTPSDYQRDMANRLAGAGCDIIIGSHPHVVQTEETLTAPDGRKVYVHYSLGNFISNQRWRYSDTGLALNLRVQKKEGQVIVTPTHLPFWVDKEDAKGRVAYTAVPLGQQLANNHYKLGRLSKKDVALMMEALEDFTQLN